MTDSTDRIIAAIFTASMCRRLEHPDHHDYFEQYEEFMRLTEERSAHEATRRAADATYEGVRIPRLRAEKPSDAPQRKAPPKRDE